MTATFALVMTAFALVQLYALRATVNALEARHDARLKALEQGRKSEATGKAGQLPDYLKPVENFEPKKPETLRPKQVKGRDVQGVENVIEFDVKI